MSSGNKVLDASALLAYLQEEPGAEIVAAALSVGAHISAANWAEVLSKLTEQGQAPAAVAKDLEDRGILGVGLVVHPLDQTLALRVAELRPLTRHLGLSLGDRACLALASQLHLGALTTDRDWKELDIGVEIQLIRHQESMS